MERVLMSIISNLT